MQTLLSDFLSAYLLVGYIVTACVIVIFIFTGKHIFHGVRNRLSTRYQIGYVLAMLIIMPVFYIFFFKEIGALNRKWHPNDPQRTGK